MKDLEKLVISKDQNKNEKLIDSLPGFDKKLSAIVSAEVGDFNRFDSAKQFKAFVGLDPKITQSGNMDKKGRITKRGNYGLRCGLYLAANVARIYDPKLKAFFEKKMKEGKHFKVAICAVARKLCEIIFAVVKSGIDYDSEYGIPKKAKT